MVLFIYFLCDGDHCFYLVRFLVAFSSLPQPVVLLAFYSCSYVLLHTVIDLSNQEPVCIPVPLSLQLYIPISKNRNTVNSEKINTIERVIITISLVKLINTRLRILSSTTKRKKMTPLDVQPRALEF